MPQDKRLPPREGFTGFRQRAIERLRVLAVVVAHWMALLVVATIPGSVSRPLVVELTAPPLPTEVTNRPATLEVLLYRRAVDGSRGAPITEARVRAFTILDGKAYSASDVRTNDGHATLSKLPLGEHWIVAEASGHARASRMVMLVAGARSLELLLGAAHELDVEVVDEAGAGLGDAEIEVQGGDPFPLGARADTSGRAHVSRLSEGPYVVTVNVPGFDALEVRHPSDKPLRVVMKKLAAVKVVVLGPDGAHVAGARVEITSAVLWPSRRADTSADGSVRIGSLPEGTYALRATLGGLSSTTELAVTLARGEEKTLTLRLAQGMSIQVRVLDGDSDPPTPLAGARVVLAESGLAAFPVEGMSGKDGALVLGPIPRGGASIMASRDGYVSVTVAVNEGPVDVVLEKAGTLVGRVVDARGYAVDGARIEIVGTDLKGMPVADDPRRARFRAVRFDSALGGSRPLVPAGELGVMPGKLPDTPHGDGPPRTVGLGGGSGGEGWISERDGRFRATPVTPGRVRALVRHPQYVEASSDLVDLAPGGSAEVTVVMRAGGLLEGRVFDSRDRPVEGAEVVAMATRGTYERVTKSDRTGSFAFASLPEDVTLVVDRPPGQPGSPARLEAKVPEGGRASVRVVLLDPRDDLPVRVVDSRGEGIDGAQVTVGSLDPRAPLRATVFTDRRGEAKLGSARGLPLHVEVRAPHTATRALEIPDTATEIRVELSPSESVEGEVRTSRRDGVLEASVTFYCEDGAHRTRTDKDGVFVVKDVPSGTCRWVVRAPGFAPRSAEVEVAASRGRRATTLPRVVLAEEAIVEGEVLDGRGQPVPLARVAKDSVPIVLVSGAPPPGVAETDARGRFRLAELPDGLLTLEAYAAGRGHVRLAVRTYAGRTTKNVRLTLLTDKDTKSDLDARGAGGVAITLGETGGPRPDVGIVSVVEGSAAERAGLEPGDLLLEVSGVEVHSIAEARGRLTGPLGDDVVVKLRRGNRVESRRVSREEVRK